MRTLEGELRRRAEKAGGGVAGAEAWLDLGRYLAWADPGDRDARQAAEALEASVARRASAEALMLLGEVARDEDERRRALERADVLIRDRSQRKAELSPYHLAVLARARARVAALRGHDEEAEGAFIEATDRFRALGYPFWIGVCLTDRAEWLADRGRTAEAVLVAEEARSLFERLGARPWLDRLAESGGVGGKILLIV